jgi:curved DNA-binding protein CbpA
MKDYYKILEIQPDASLEVMNNAYRALVRKYHPDLYHTRLKAPMTAKMQEINEAYNILSIPASRAEYDRRYAAARAAHKNVTPSPPAAVQWKRLLLWSLGTFLLGKLLLKLPLVNAFGRLLLLGGFLYLIFHLLTRVKRKS